MPRLEVTLEPIAREAVVPGEFGVRIVVRNPSAEPVRFHTYQARHPALVLELTDEEGRPIFLPPPPPPDERDLAAPDDLRPGDSVTLEYVGFLDSGLARGRYRVRFFAPYPEFGGTPDDPVASEWTSFAVSEPQLPPGTAVGDIRIRPESFEIGWFWRFWQRLLDALHRIECAIRRIVFGQRCDDVHTQEVDQPRTQTITNAPPGSEAWNRTSNWRARFRLVVDEGRCRATVTIRVRLVGTITDAQRAAWETAIESAWNNRFKLCCRCCCCCCTGGYHIATNVEFVAAGEHQVVNVGTDTVNMGLWGAADTVDVRHEFGHMLGALDEYFTVNGVDHNGGRRPDGNIMNNPANEPEAHHYDVVRAGSEGLLGTTCATRAVGSPC